MFKLLKYLKPFTLLIIITVFLLFIQAMCNLALPDYMSNIVNVGVQQSGITDKVPAVISEDGMKLIIIYMNDKDKNEFKSCYDFYESYTGDLTKKFASAGEKPVYVLNKGESEKATEIYTKACWLMLLDMQSMQGTAGSGQTVNENPKPEGLFNQIKWTLDIVFGKETAVSTGTSVDISEIYKYIPMLEATVPVKLTELEKNAGDITDTMASSVAMGFIKSFYGEFGYDFSASQNRYILYIGFLMLLVSLAGAVCIVIIGYLAAKTSAGLARNLRYKIFTKVNSFSNAEFDSFSTASLITRSTNDITNIQMMIMFAMRMVFYAPIMGVGGVIRAVSKSSSMSWIIALSVIILLGMVVSISSLVLPRFVKIQKLIDKINLVLRENLSGLMVVRAFRRQSVEEARFDKENKELTRTNLFVNRVFAVMMPTMTFVMNAVMLLIVWVGSHEISRSSMQVGDMMAFMQYAVQILMSFLMLSIMFIMIPSASVSVKRVTEVLEVEPTIKDKENAKIIENPKGVVEFDNVSFKYPDAKEYSLKNISFTANPGQTTAIIGATGSGKSTIINLLLRFYDVTEGSVKLDGVDVRDLKHKDLLDKIGYVPQKSFLFKGTIKSNLEYAKGDATEADMRRVAEISQVMEFIEKKPDGFESEIAQGGDNVSGGQRQRLSIARALIKNAPVYVFDDSFSALDFKTDLKLRTALKEGMADSTLIIVAQRVGTIMNANQIIVLDQGEIVGKGTHDYLIKNCGTYREIAESQLGKESV